VLAASGSPVQPGRTRHVASANSTTAGPATVEPAPSDSAEEDAWLRFERERVQAALKQLPDQQREALELAYYGGFSQSELAERLGQPVGTIKSRMFTGLARLRELLAEPGNGETAWKPTPSTT
jgi:RNA polymerase sigma-70 factor (ECF subfamily)